MSFRRLQRRRGQCGREFLWSFIKWNGYQVVYWLNASLQLNREMETGNRNDIEVSSLRWPIMILYGMCLMINSFNVRIISDMNKCLPWTMHTTIFDVSSSGLCSNLSQTWCHTIMEYQIVKSRMITDLEVNSYHYTGHYSWITLVKSYGLPKCHSQYIAFYYFP